MYSSTEVPMDLPIRNHLAMLPRMAQQPEDMSPVVQSPCDQNLRYTLLRTLPTPLEISNIKSSSRSQTGGTLSCRQLVGSSAHVSTESTVSVSTTTHFAIVDRAKAATTLGCCSRSVIHVVSESRTPFRAGLSHLPDQVLSGTVYALKESLPTSLSISDSSAAFNDPFLRGVTLALVSFILLGCASAPGSRLYIYGEFQPAACHRIFVLQQHATLNRPGKLFVAHRHIRHVLPHQSRLADPRGCETEALPRYVIGVV